jgi:uncharacterized lipoprotein YmbA
MSRSTITGVTCSILLLAVPGCSTFTPQEDPTRYYALTATSTGRLAARPDLAVGVGPVVIPGYLDHKEIVTAGEANDLTLADYHVWAEPLEKAITRVVSKNLSQLLGSPTVAPFPDADARFGFRTGIVVRRFEMGADGKVRLDASYAIDQSAHSLDLAAARSRTITVAVAQPDSYPAVVAAMSDALGQFSSSLAQDLVTLERRRTTESPAAD